MKREELHKQAGLLKNCLCFRGCQTTECWASTTLNGRSNAWERMISCSTRGLTLGFQLSRKHWLLLWLAGCITALPDHPDYAAVSVWCCVYQCCHSTQASTARLRAVEAQKCQLSIPDCIFKLITMETPKKNEVGLLHIASLLQMLHAFLLFFFICK